ncbi:hypothetical protein ACIQ9Q_40685 [Streptomyces sp. NPDC094438]
MAQFLAVHHGQGPGILWPEHGHPAHDGPDATTVLEAETRDLEHLTGLPVAVERYQAADEGTRLLSAGSSEHLLVHQASGAGSWRLRAGAGTAAEQFFSCRLRSGEMLYIPPDWAWHADLTPSTQLLLTRLGPPTAHTGEAKADLPTSPSDRQPSQDVSPRPW